MEVYGKPGGGSKVIEDSLEARGRRGLRLANNESVVGILEHRNIKTINSKFFFSPTSSSGKPSQSM
jgi:hypothetical protein